MSKTREWNKYAVGEPSKRSNWTNSDCCPLETVHHICHLNDAFRMLEDGKIRSSLIWDESRLNNTRTCVSWLSPNHWPNGSLYGNVEFHFKWRDLVEGKNFFWVEAIEKYNPTAFRILITDEDAVGDLEPYPVKDGDGPVFFDRGADKWFWNGDLTGEFMFDEDIPLRLSTSVGFCKHHPSICRKDGASCPDLDLRGDVAGERLIAKSIAHRAIRSSSRMRKLFMSGDELNDDVERCVKNLLYRISKAPTDGKIRVGDAAALPLATAILDRLSRESSLDALTELFLDSSELELAVRKRMSKTFEIAVEDFPSSADDY
jgi:hypothetical protein